MKNGSIKNQGSSNVAIGKESELDPDWMDNIFSAVEELGWGWDTDEFMKELGWM